MSEQRAPIALFAYDRPSHLKRTLDALANNDLAGESDLIVFADGARGTGDAERVEQVARLLGDLPPAFRTLTVHARTANRGLAGSIVEGVGKVLEEHNRVIVLEDDLVTSPWFLRFANDALRMYEDRDDVISVSGYCYPVDTELPETFFRLGADCWGWATWRRGWALFEEDGGALLSEIRRRGFQRTFDLDGACSYSQMLEENVQGKNDSWAIRWQASAQLAGKFTLYPGRTLIHNAGHDGSGTHSGPSSAYGDEHRLSSERVGVRAIPVVETPAVREAHIRFFRQTHAVPPVPLPRRVARAFKSRVRRDSGR